MKKPDCEGLSRTCREIDVTIKVADLDDDTRRERDDAATWITAHHERMTFGDLYESGSDLVVDARIHVPCRYLALGVSNGEGPMVSCGLHGFEGPLPATERDAPPQLDVGDGTFLIVRKGKRLPTPLALKNGTSSSAKKSKKHKRKLPVVKDANPCATAPCRTSDNKRGAACCRDLRLEVVLPKSSRNEMALLKARKSPYLCKVQRENKHIVEIEVISACGYLGEDNVSCVLHDRRRPNGKKAKPQLCYDWPDFGEDETGHTGCVFDE